MLDLEMSARGGIKTLQPNARKNCAKARQCKINHFPLFTFSGRIEIIPVRVKRNVGYIDALIY